MMLPLIPDSGRRRGMGVSRHRRFAVAESWLGESLDKKENAQALALRYFAAFGPATAKDLPDMVRPRHGRRHRRRAAAEADRAARRAQARAVRPAQGAASRRGRRRPRAIPAGVRQPPARHADRTRIIANEHKPALASRNLFIPATFLVDGFMAGTWTYEVKKRVARLTLNRSPRSQNRRAPR